ncbi:hypothetical protein RhiirA4_420363 [Rhizophagus irregularis]|uniref:Uncharacterized protein n=1 Tax=Rhizophagus irregularis TaxID=588596 RepID=A0A2I1GHI0_9GLOM|nr:hypothetical protein RhiirA4_420363 [Rhizophagus irregularis]
MRILPKSAHETIKEQFFEKRGWTLHMIFIFTKKDDEMKLDVRAYDHWFTDTKQNAWFTASSFEAVFGSIEKKPKWINVISDNGPHYHNSELMSIVAHWYDWYQIQVRSWLFLEPGEAKTIIDSHHASELTVSFRNRGLTWHSPDQVKNLCHVCGRLGCSPSQCSPRPAKKTSTQLDKLYSRFKAGPQRGRTSDHSQRSSSRSRSRSRNTRPNNHRTGPNNNGSQQSGSRPPASTSSSKPIQPRNQQSQPIGRPTVTSPTQQTGPTITPEEVAALRQQIVELSKTIRSMDERIDWFSAQLESHEYRIAELENSVYPDANPHSSYENFESYQDNQEERQESDEIYNWDDADRVATKLPPQRSMIMQISPDTSFSHDAPANVLSSRHLSFPTSEVLQPRRPQTVSQPINFHKELDNLTSTQELIHGQLGSIMSKLDGLSPPISTTEPATVNQANSNPDGSPSVGW